jgi:hypothetical protein
MTYFYNILYKVYTDPCEIGPPVIYYSIYLECKFNHRGKRGGGGGGGGLWKFIISKRSGHEKIFWKNEHHDKIYHEFRNIFQPTPRH